jgi:hypothetical protein
MKRNHEGYLQRVAEREADGMSAAEEAEKFGLTFDYQVWHIPFFSVARAFVIGNFAPTKIGKVESTKNGKIQPSIHLHART